MYLLLCMLALTDIVLSSSVIPKALCIFWFNLNTITLAGCVTQIIFLTTVSITYSAVLVAMAFDRYIAICSPLRYATILSNARITKMGLVGLMRGLLCTLPLPVLLSRLPFCGTRIIPHTYCEPIAVAKISCGDLTGYRIYGLVLNIFLIGLDLSLIVLSYCLIFRAVLRISSKKVHHKALNTCTSHLCVVLMYQSCGLFSTVSHRFGQGIAPPVHVILGNFYVFVPPMLNPIIYGVKTKVLRDRKSKYISRL
ncbi:olfactory receptor 52B2-like [Carettochelys insculpta]|uniref:olfactory receptor 52B2-like n=1 Tax=Carettochelys insculpta TaxID=44489 RepID=UPI003EB9B4A4